MKTLGRFAVVLTLALVPAVTGCTAEQIMTPEQTAQLEVFDAAADEAAAEAKGKEDAAKEALDAVGVAIKSGDADATLAAMQAFEDTKVAFDESAAVVNARLSERKEFMDGVIEGRAAPITGFLSAIVSTVFPAAAPYAGWLDMLAIPIAGLFFKRNHKRLKWMGKSIIKGQIGDVVVEMGRSLGWLHSNSDPALVLAGARRAALDAGDTAMAATIAAIIPPTT